MAIYEVVLWYTEGGKVNIEADNIKEALIKNINTFHREWDVWKD